MSDIYLVLTDNNEPVAAFANEADAKIYVSVQSRGSTLMPARKDLRVFPIVVWRAFDKLLTAMQKIDSTWGATTEAVDIKASA